jgi:carbonic anhydrase/acetyltransferase-like protein (isoleucine patch superfamily)
MFYTEFPPGSLILSNPAKLVRSLTLAEIERNRRNVAIYVDRARAWNVAGWQTGG